MADGGWIKLYRSVRSHWLWENGNERYAKWWIDILMMVNHESHKVLVNGKLIEIAAGERLTSINKLATQWGATRRTVDRFLKLLADDDMISFNKSRENGTTLKVLHYADYQQFEAKSVKGSAQVTAQVMTQRTAQRTAQRTTHKQEPKNDKNNTPSNTISDRFESLWKLYPRKQGKQSALKAYKKAVKDGITDDQIKTGIESYIQYLTREHKDPQFIKQGSSFFNERSWKDDWSSDWSPEKASPEPPVSKRKTKAAAALREIQDEMANYPDTPREEAAQLAARAITENGHPTTAAKILGFLDKMEKEGVSNE